MALVVLFVVLYFSLPCIYAYCFLDWNTIRYVERQRTLEDRAFEVPCLQGRSVLIRRYGSPDSSYCVVFFSGQHGGIPGYEKPLFRDMVHAGLTVYALSYPGQDGASGKSRLSTVGEDVATALDTLDALMFGKLKSAVFVGRSLGATVAVFEAERFHPKALLLDGVSPSLSDAIRAQASKHWFTYLWSYLPFESLLTNQYDIVSPLEKLREVPVWIFQGSCDDTAPLSNINTMLNAMPHINLEVVQKGDHGDIYKVDHEKYISVLLQLAHQR
jgi:pimeloyl-ACP methyl ester carboxylesterase